MEFISKVYSSFVSYLLKFTPFPLFFSETVKKVTEKMVSETGVAAPKM